MEKLTIEQGLEKYNRYIKWKAYRLSNGNYHDAEDIVSEAMCLVYRDRAAWNAFDNNFRHWISQRLYSAARRYKYGGESTLDALNSTQEMDAGYVETFYKTEESIVMPMSEIQDMPHPNVAVYRYMGYENQEIAELIGVSVRTVKQRAKDNADHYKGLYGSEPKHKTGLAAIDFQEARRLINYTPLTGMFNWKVNRGHTVKAGDVAGGYNEKQRCYNVRLNNVIIKGHRLAWAMSYGVSEFGTIECVNGNRKDLRIENLEEKK